MTQEIPNVETASIQEIFDFVTTKLIDQNCQSIGESGACMYRGVEGQKCAAGWLIPDERYNENFENETVESKFVIKAIIPNFDILNEDHWKKQKIIRSLQRIHDSYKPCYWKEQFKDYALHNNLVYKF